jgi:hypothetical protein
MAKFPIELFAMSGANVPAQDRVSRFYDKLFGLCRWFQVGLNGIVFPYDPGESRLDPAYVCSLIGKRTGAERERIEQFGAQLVELLTSEELAFEGTFEIYNADNSPDTWNMVKIAYVRRPFWKWY